MCHPVSDKRRLKSHASGSERPIHSPSLFSDLNWSLSIFLKFPREAVGENADVWVSCSGHFGNFSKEIRDLSGDKDENKNLFCRREKHCPVVGNEYDPDNLLLLLHTWKTNSWQCPELVSENSFSPFFSWHFVAFTFIHAPTYSHMNRWKKHFHTLTLRESLDGSGLWRRPENYLFFSSGSDASLCCCDSTFLH